MARVLIFVDQEEDYWRGNYPLVAQGYQPTTLLFRRLFLVGVFYYGNESKVCRVQEELEGFLRQLF